MVPEATPVAAPEPPQASDCVSQLSKYDWPQADAYKIMMKESGNTPTTVNDNPSTGDYSVGCWQTNLIGSLAKSRPSAEWLLNSENSTKWAYEHYVAEGRTFCKTSGWYNSCRATGVK